MTAVLLIDDDALFTHTLANAFHKRGDTVETAHTHEEALTKMAESNPEWVVLDLKIPGTSGLRLIPELLAIEPFAHIVVLTGFAHVTTAVEAIKLGARHYLSKPVGLEEIVEAFQRIEGDSSLPIDTDANAASRLDVVEWSHIQAILEKNGGNISATARELNMHRRTLQRKLGKRPPQV